VRVSTLLASMLPDAKVVSHPGRDLSGQAAARWTITAPAGAGRAADRLVARHERARWARWSSLLLGTPILSLLAASAPRRSVAQRRGAVDPAHPAAGHTDADSAGGSARSMRDNRRRAFFSAGALLILTALTAPLYLVCIAHCPGMTVR
jgi:hypothetical protein